MPISIPYEWEETTDTLTVQFQLPPFDRKKLDVYISDLFIKVNANPYIGHLDLFDLIDEPKSSAVVHDKGVTFKLTKKTPGLWSRVNFAGERKEALYRRQASVVREQERLQKATEDAMEHKQKEGKITFDAQWALERGRRETIEERKATDKRNAEEEVYDWQRSIENKAYKRLANIEEDEDDYRSSVIFGEEGEEEIPSLEKPKSASSSSSIPPVRQAPPVRGTAKIQVTFTPRILPTPAREGKDEELKKQLGLDQPKIDPDRYEQENNPVWLRDKGDSLFKSGDAAGAINAYSDALARSVPGKHDTIAYSCMMNRSACYLRIEEWAMCIRDCQDVLAMLSKNISESSDLAEKQLNVSRTVKALVRRGTCWARIGAIEKAYADYKRALELDPTNEDVAADLEQIAGALFPQDMVEQQQQAESRPNPNGMAMKEQADRMLIAGDLKNALIAYSQAIQLAPRMLPIYLNRALCYLKMEEYFRCVGDCDIVIANASGLQHRTLEKELEEEEGSEGKMDKKQLTSVMLKAYVRRGAAYLALRNWTGAFEDYEQALRIDPANEELQRDVEKLSSRLHNMTQASWEAHRGQYLASVNDHKGAMEAFTAAIAKDSESPQYYNLRAGTWMSLREYQKCMDDCDAALALIPRNKGGDGPPAADPLYLNAIQSPEQMQTMMELQKQESEYAKDIRGRKQTAASIVELHQDAANAAAAGGAASSS